MRRAPPTGIVFSAAVVPAAGRCWDLCLVSFWCVDGGNGGGSAVLAGGGGAGCGVNVWDNEYRLLRHDLDMTALVSFR